MEHLERGKEILKILINNGCEAYLIGEAVCNTILTLPFDEVEITTSATPDMVKGIFGDYKVEDEKEGYVRLYYLGYQFLIGTFKMGSVFKDNRRPLRIHYSKNLHDDLLTRDFTINAIAMSPAGKLTDAYRGFEDIRKKKIKTIGNPKVRFLEEPLRMLIALRFVSELGFRIERRTYRAMKRKSKLLLKLEIETMLKEMKRILNGKYFKKALFLIYDSGIYKRIPVLRNEFKRLANNYRQGSLDTFLACSFVKAGGFNDEWGRISDEPGRLREIVELAMARPKGNFTPQELFFRSLDICLEANKVNRLLKRSHKRDKHIRKAHVNLPIHDISELTFSMNDMRFMTKGRDTFNDEIFEKMLMKVLVRELPNNYHDLRDFVTSSLGGYLGESFLLSLNQEPVPEVYEREENPPFKDTESDVWDEYPLPETPAFPTSLSNTVNYSEPVRDNKFEDLEAKIRKLELQNLEMKLSRDVESLVGQNLEMLKEMKYIDGAEKVLVSRELKEIYRNLITDVDPKLRPLKDTGKINKERNEPKYEKED